MLHNPICFALHAVLKSSSYGLNAFPNRQGKYDLPEQEHFNCKEFSRGTGMLASVVMKLFLFQRRYFSSHEKYSHIVYEERLQWHFVTTENNLHVFFKC